MLTLCHLCHSALSCVSICHVTPVTSVSQYASVPLEIFSRVLTEGQENLRKIRNEDTNEVEVVLEKRMNESRTHKREGYFVVEVRMDGWEGGGKEIGWEGGRDGGTGVDEREGRVEDKKEWMREEEERMGERGVDEGGSG